jgi:NAD-dependent deacetylase
MDAAREVTDSRCPHSGTALFPQYGEALGWRAFRGFNLISESVTILSTGFDMPKRPIDFEKVVVFTGAGISAPSGIATYRGIGGLWNEYNIDEVATAEAWQRQPERALEFYNQQKAAILSAQPNAAHRAIAELEQHFSVIVITQNIDGLHERAGSTCVIHLHGEVSKARSSKDPSLVYSIGDAPIRVGDRCALGSQLRPHIIWFGEPILDFTEAKEQIATAGKILVIGTSLLVEPAAGLLKHSRYRATKVIVDLERPETPYGFRFHSGSADLVVPKIVASWIDKRGNRSEL